MPEPAKTLKVAQTLGPGSLKFGKTGSEIEFAAHTTKTEYDPGYSNAESTPMLDGSTFQPEGDWKGKITGTFFQSLMMSGLEAWTHAHAGETIDFTFTPKTGAGNIKLTGQCVISPVKIGGDAGKTNTTDFEFSVLGRPRMETATQ